MPWPKTGATYYKAKLGLPYQGGAIKVGCLIWLLLNVIFRVFVRKKRYLAPLSYLGLYNGRVTWTLDSNLANEVIVAFLYNFFKECNEEKIKKRLELFSAYSPLDMNKVNRELQLDLDDMVNDEALADTVDESLSATLDYDDIEDADISQQEIKYTVNIL